MNNGSAITAIATPLRRSLEGRKVDTPAGEEILFLAGSANMQLAEDIVQRLGTTLGKVTIKKFADGETYVQVDDVLRGRDVYLIQPTAPPVNEHLMELLLMISTCRRASARSITAVIPYYGYARQDRKVHSRTPISAADVAKLLETMGLDRVISMDLHCAQIQGFFSPQVPMDNLQTSTLGVDHFCQPGKLEGNEKSGMKAPVVVSPDAGGVYRAKTFQEGMIVRGFKDCALAMLIKHRPEANKIDRMDLVGDVDGRDAIIVDDIVDTAGTLCEAAKQLKLNGAKRVFAFITHGLLSGPAVDRIGNSVLEELVITDTLVSLNKEKASNCPKVKTVSVSLLLAEAIRRTHQKESLSVLFKHQNYVETAKAATEKSEATLQSEKKNAELNKELKNAEEGSAKRARVA